MKKYNEYFKIHLEEQLTQINANYKYRIEFNQDIEKEKNNPNPRIDISERELFIVLTNLPSASYGDNVIVQQMEMTILCDQRYMEDAMDIFSQYQSSVVNKKYWEDTTLIYESWYSPSVEENFLRMNINKGATITMTGSVSFCENVVSIKDVYILGEKIKYITLIPSATAISLATTSITDARAKSINKGVNFGIKLKIKISDNAICKAVRLWMDGDENINKNIPVKFVYTDNYEKEYNMIIDSALPNYEDGVIPTLSIDLRERFGGNS